VRRTDPGIRQRRTDLLHGSVLGERALSLRIFCESGDRLLITNLGPDLDLDSPTEPLLAPEGGATWQTVWCSEELKYGGQGYSPVYAGGRFAVPARSTVLLATRREYSTPPPKP